MNGRQLLHDRRAQIGLGVAGVAGVYVLAKRKGATGTTSTSAAGLDGASSGGGVGAYNSTATDVAQQLSDYKTGQQQVLDDFASQLNTTLDRFTLPQAGSPAGTGIGGTSPITPTLPVTATPVTTPTTVNAPASAPVGSTNGVPTGSINRGTIGSTVAKYVTIAKGQNWNTVAAASKDSTAQLRALNGGSLGALKAGTRVRIG